MQVLNPAVVKVNNTNVNVLAVDTGAYPDVGIADILAYNHINDPAAQGTTLRAGLAGRFDLLTCGLPSIPVILYGNRYPTVGSLVLYKLTVLTKEQEFTASATGGATVIATNDGIVVQMPETAGDVILTINNYAFRIIVQDPATVDPYIPDQIITGIGIIPNVATVGFGNAVVISKDGNWLITGIQGFDVDGSTLLNYIAVYTKIQNGNKYLWQLHATLAPTSPDTGDSFGKWAYDINADGSVIIVGAHDSKVTDGNFTPETPALNAGDVALYVRTGQTWDAGHRFTLIDNWPDTNKGLGYSVAIDDAGTRFIAGQPNILESSDTAEISTMFVVCDFNPTTSTFSPRNLVIANYNERIGSKFAKGVAISGDGTKFFVSNFFYPSVGDTPTARIDEYNFVDETEMVYHTSYTLPDTIQTSPTNYESFGDRNIAISDDTNTILVGFYNATVDGADGCGTALVLKRQGGGWVKHSELYPESGIMSYTLFGSKVDMTPDASYLFISSFDLFDTIPSESGTVFVFKYDAQSDSYSTIKRILSEYRQRGRKFGASISYDRVSKYLAISQEYNPDETSTGMIHYIPISTLVV